MRLLPLLIVAALFAGGVCEVKITDAYIKMGNVHATVEAGAQNKGDETAVVAVKAYFYEGAQMDKATYIADNSETVTLAPGSKTEVKVAILYATGAFTLGKTELYLNGQFVQLVEYKK